jgi:hypothetical protein
MTKRIWVIIAMLMTSGVASASECVVLLHGLARTSISMNKMQRELRRSGFETVNIDYPSRKFTVEVLAPMAVAQGVEECRKIEGVTSIHFVTHSLGGILLRQYLSENEIPELGRVVMFAPPNQGSIAADELRDVPGYDWVHGPVGRQLGKGDESVPLKLGPVDFELGVIAGTRSTDPIASSVLPNPDDGRVSVEDTKIDGMRDHAVVSHSHTFMIRMRKPIDLTIRFLRTGSFAET